MGTEERKPPQGFEEVFVYPHRYSLVGRRCRDRLDRVREYADPQAIRRECVLHLLYHRHQDRMGSPNRRGLAEQPIGVEGVSLR